MLGDRIESGLDTISQDSAIVSRGGVVGALLVLDAAMPNNQAGDAKIALAKHRLLKAIRPSGSDTFGASLAG
jgi:hypothetical protein